MPHCWHCTPLSFLFFVIFRGGHSPTTSSAAAAAATTTFSSAKGVSSSSHYGQSTESAEIIIAFGILVINVVGIIALVGIATGCCGSSTDR
jgi:hypothetical protein